PLRRPHPRGDRRAPLRGGLRAGADHPPVPALLLPRDPAADAGPDPDVPEDAARLEAARQTVPRDRASLRQRPRGQPSPGTSEKKITRSGAKFPSGAGGSLAATSWKPKCSIAAGISGQTSVLSWKNTLVPPFSRSCSIVSFSCILVGIDGTAE